MKMSEEKMNELIERKHIEDSLRQEFEGMLSERIDRYLLVKPHPIIPNEHFAAASTECSHLFRDGHFYGCISLAQAVAEALVKFICQRNSWNPDDNFEKNVKKLSTRGFIPDKLRESLLAIWKQRDDYHHLNPNVETDRRTLEELARKKARLLSDVESEIFAFSTIDGKLVPKYPKYWDINGDQAHVFLRLEP